ncbi:sorting nexin-16-like [Polymixia lowei]
MTTPFVPVPFPVDRTGGSWLKRTSPMSSCSSSNCGSSCPEGIPWVKGAGSMGAPVLCPSLAQPCSSPAKWQSMPKGGAVEGSSFLEDGSPEDYWVERPTTPTLLGYEVMEERAKFTVYKILVAGRQGDSWVIFRRYADFSRLNDKLKELFPRFRLALPPKRWFKDNYDMEFLEERQIGLQTFLQNLIAHKDIINSEVVRHFLCLDDPPSPFDSLEESRAFCETLEETNHRLQRELLEKQKEIDHLKRTVEQRDTHITLLEKEVNAVPLRPESSESPCQLSVVSSESNTHTGQDIDRHRVSDTCTPTEGDTDVNADGQRHIHRNEEVETETDRESSTGISCDAPQPIKNHSAYWSTLVITGSHVPS